MTAGRSRSGLTLFACAVAFLLPVAFSPSVYATFWAPKAALLPVIAAVGLPRLILLAKEPSPNRAPARAALAFLGVASLSTVLAHNHTTAVFGLYLWGTGLIFVMALVGAWSIGVSLDENGRRDLARALLAGVMVNVVFALWEMLGDLSSFELARYDGRSIGLMGNPVHLGALLAGGLALAMPWHGRRLLPWLVACASIAAAIEVSGSRAALLAMLGVFVVCACSRAMRNRLGMSRLVAVSLALILGFGGGATLTEWGGGVSVTGRVTQADGGGGVAPRLAMWWATRQAIADRPIVGSGPGTYREATSQYRTIKVARAFGPDNYFTDAHNLVVEYLTTTGIFGLIALLTWTFLAFRKAVGPLRPFAAAVLLVGLAEPQFAGTTPLAFLALGASLTSCRKQTVAEEAESAASDLQPEPTLFPNVQLLSTLMSAVLVVITFTGGAVLLIGEFHLEQASLDFNRFHANRALALLPRWPRPAAVRARIETFEGRIERDPAKLLEARRWQKEAIRRDPTNPFSWLVLAESAEGEGRPEEAMRAYRRVLELNPMSTRACNGLASLAHTAGRADETRLWLARSLAINPDQPAIRRALLRVEEQER